MARLGVARKTEKVMIELLLAYGVVFLVNLAPAFMPPTWSILAFFLVRTSFRWFPWRLAEQLLPAQGDSVLLW